MNNNLNNNSNYKIITKKTSSGRIAKIQVKINSSSSSSSSSSFSPLSSPLQSNLISPNISPQRRRQTSPSRHDTARTSTGLKVYPRSLSPKKKFKIGSVIPIQRRCDSPLKNRIIEIYKNFTPSLKNYKSVNPRWKK